MLLLKFFFNASVFLMTNDTCISGDFKRMHLAVNSSMIASLSFGKVVIHPNNLFVPSSILPFNYYFGCGCKCS
jgi:hypothetical protein